MTSVVDVGARAARSRFVLTENHLSAAARFWRGHIRIGFALMGGEALAAIVYLTLRHGPHRPLQLSIAGVTAVLAVPGSLAAGWVARRAWRETFALGWTAACVVALFACAYLDGGLDSPFLYLGLLPIMYSALILRPRAVVVCGVGSLLGLLAVGFTDSNIEIPRDSLSMLTAVVVGAFILALVSSAHRCQLETSRASLVAQLYEMGATDQLTGCSNQGAFHERLETEVDRAVRYERPLSLMVCDVDLFKTFNDTYGHQQGDAALRAIATRLRTAARSSDVVARLGGDEFAILMPETSSSEAAELAARIVEAQANNKPGDPPTVSIGIAGFDPAIHTPLALFASADAAMYRAKAAGRSRAVESGEPLVCPIEPGHACPDGRRAAEVARSERRQRLESELILAMMLEEAPIGFAFVDPELRILRANPALMAMTPAPVANNVGRNIGKVIPHLWPQLEPHFQQLLHDGLPVRNLEIVDPNRDDPSAAALGNLYPVRLDGRTIGIGVVVVDIADRKRLESTQELLTDAVVRALVAAVEARDPYTAGHQRRVADIAGATGRALGYDAWTVKGITLAASIHDIGKIAIPAEILSKPARLTNAEFELMKGHPRAGHDMLAGIEFPWPVSDMIIQHHERLDGSGYPNGLHADQIGIGARIIAVADVIEAMSAHRPYRSSMGIDAALEAVNAGRGTLFDSDVVDACLSAIRAQGILADTRQQ
jgi:diguanylate cyclase (GGDEF)-like protein